MDTLQNIQKYLENFFELHTEKQLSYNIIKEHFPESHILYISNRVKDNLSNGLGENKKQQKERFESFGYASNQIGHPILSLLKIIDSFQEFLNNKCINSEQKAINEIKKNLDEIKNSIIRGYLLRDLEEFEYLFMAESEKNPYTNLHFERIKTVINTIRNEGILSKVDVFEIRQAFNTWVNQPEIELILGDEKEWITMLHKAAQRLIHSIVYHMKTEDLFQVYILFKELSKKMLYLIYTLDDLYYMFLEHKDKRLAEYIKKEAEIDVYSHLTIISITNFKTIERVWGTSISNELSSLINLKLKELLKSFGDGFLYVQGTSGEFFVFSPIVFSNQIIHMQKSIKDTIRKVQIKEKGNTIDCKISLGSLDMESIKTLSRDTIIKFIYYLREEAYKHNDILFNFQEKERESILDKLKKEQSKMELINKSLNDENIVIYFQPIIDMNTNELYDLEALVRIILTDGTIVKAEEFIDMVYQMDKIMELDTIVIRKIHEQRSKIAQVTKKIFINVSPLSLKSPDFREILLEKMPDITEAGLTVTMELTEQAFLENIDVLQFVKEKFNLSFAVDDFGTGYSSLRTVADLSQKGLISFLKIDGSLIKDIVTSDNTFNVVNTIFKMTNTLKLKAISEYVENKECADKLKSIGMTYAQGHLYSPASSIEDLIEKLPKNKIKKPKFSIKYFFKKIQK